MEAQYTAAPEKNTININKPDEVTFWTDRFDTTKVKLKAAINAVGPAVKDVEAYLNKK
ncbi:MAG: hypothetical protein JWR50_867 [Mucilaginibacter sp.]|nr:hypothetical protein [Mucilaginibacter sp.]